MGRKKLKNKPLVEAIFELRWELQEPTTGVRVDPHYKILIGTIYDKIKNEYPFHEQLPTATMPDEIAGYIVQHRFRKEKDGWPLIQIGPGIVTLNDTSRYTWEDFENRISSTISTLFDTYPDSKNLNIKELALRYIDAINFDFEKEDIFDFLEEKMKTDIEIYPKLFTNTGVEESPLGFDLRVSFPSTKPDGAMYIRFGRGKNKEADALLWETMVKSNEKNPPKIKEDIAMWVKDAHELTDDWFFKIIEGELEERFE